MSEQRQLQAQKEQNHQMPNHTNIPIQMKLDFEKRSGLSFDDVRVHYHSDKPARIGALAYTQGNQVYIGPGQERHLRHELGHVIQQKQSQVSCTKIINGAYINDNYTLEKEADQWGTDKQQQNNCTHWIESHQNKFMGNPPVIQRKGEQESVRNTVSVRRGNRLNSIVGTEKYSYYMLSKFRDFWPELSEYLKKTYRGFAQNERIYAGLAAELAGYGNCGEFADIVYSSLARMKDRKSYIYRCYMIKNLEKEEEEDGYDHALVVSSPSELTLKSGDNFMGSYIDFNDMPPEKKAQAIVLDGWNDYSICTLQQFYDGLNPYGAKISESGGLGVYEYISTPIKHLPNFDKIRNIISHKIKKWKAEHDTPEVREYVKKLNIGPQGVFNFKLLNERDVNDYRTPTPFLFEDMSENEIEYYLNQPFIDVESLYNALCAMYNPKYYDKYELILKQSPIHLFKQLLAYSDTEEGHTLFQQLTNTKKVYFLQNAGIQKTTEIYKRMNEKSRKKIMNMLKLDTNECCKTYELLIHKFSADHEEKHKISKYTNKIKHYIRKNKNINFLLELNLKTAFMVLDELKQQGKANVLDAIKRDLHRAYRVLKWLKRYGQIGILDKITLKEAFDFYYYLKERGQLNILSEHDINGSIRETSRLRKEYQI